MLAHSTARKIFELRPAPSRIEIKNLIPTSLRMHSPEACHAWAEYIYNKGRGDQRGWSLLSFGPPTRSTVVSGTHRERCWSSVCSEMTSSTIWGKENEVRYPCLGSFPRFSRDNFHRLKIEFHLGRAVGDSPSLAFF